jgi:predicted neuraminidase
MSGCREDICRIDSEAPAFRECHAATIAEADGALVVAFFAGSREGQPDVGIWLSRHGADGWSPAREIANGVLPDGTRYPCWNPVLFQPAGGPLMLFYKIGPSPREWWGMLLLSRDGGATWSAPRRLPDGIWGPIKNKPIQLAGGTILCPTSSEAEGGWLSFVQLTTDRGETWETIGPLNDGHGIAAIQPTLLPYPGGRMQALCRTRQGFIASAWSEDEGRAWSPLELTPLPNPNSGIDAVMLRDGRALLVYNHSGAVAGRWGGERTPLNVALSAHGVTWQPSLVLEDEPGEYSYPSVIQTRDGNVHVVYTWQRQNIRHVCIKV